MEEWEARRRNLRSSSVLENSDANNTSRPDKSLESSTEPPTKRRKRGHRRVVLSSPNSSPPDRHGEADRQSNQNSDLEIQETQEYSALRTNLEIQVPARLSVDRDDYSYIPASTFSSQNIHSETPIISSSKETDHDSAVDIASAISEGSQGPASSPLSIERSSQHHSQTRGSHTLADGVDLQEVPRSASFTAEYITSAGSEDAVHYPEFSPEQRHPDLSLERAPSSGRLLPSPHSDLGQGAHIGVETQIDRARGKTTASDWLSSKRSASYLQQGPPINDLRFSSSYSPLELRHRLYSESLILGANHRSLEHYLDSVPRIIRNMADIPTTANPSPLQPETTVKSPSKTSFQENMALDMTGDKVSLQTSSSNIPCSSMPASTSPKATAMIPDPTLGAQPLTAGFADSGKLSVETENVLPTTELPVAMQIDSILSPNSEPDQGTPLVPSLDLPRYQQNQPRFQRPSLTAPDYAVILPAAGHMRHRYREWFQEKDLRLLGRFLQKPSSAFAKMQGSSTLLEKISAFVNQLKLATVHPDFNADPRVYESMTQTVPEPSQEAAWADMASTKFAFLGNLIEEVRPESHRIAVIASTEQSAATLETYFRGKRVPYRDFKGNDYAKSDEEQSTSAFTLIDSSDKGAQEPLLISKFSPEVIIDLDGSLTSNDPLIRIMQRNAGVGPAIPIIHLIVINSPQHIEKCLATTLTPIERLQHLVIAATHLRREIGKLPGGFEGITYEPTQINCDAIEDVPQLEEFESQIRTIATRVARSIKSHDFGESWLLPVLPALDLIGVEATMAMLDVDEDSRLASKSRTGTPAGIKRTRDQPLVPENSKRLRTTPLQDVTHISDSLQESQSELEDLRSALRSRESTLALTLQEKDRLQNSLMEKDAQFEEMTLSLSALQHRYETQKKEFHRLRKESRLLESKKVASDSMRERLSTENVSLREQRAQLQNELHAARLALREGGGTTADLESLREANENLQKERDSLQRSNENIKRDFEFTRQQYQLASSSASDLASQSAENEAEIAKLKIHASDEKRRLREMNVSEHERQHKVAVVRLEDQVAAMEKLLMKKEEELERARRSRGVQTRAGSAQPQPGSPRLVGRGGGESRGASPIPGLLNDSRLGYTHGSSGIGASGGRTSALRREA